jgi:DNA modification methylase
MAVKILVGDCRERLLELPDRSVNMVMTSPPYFGLRDYDTGEWEGGDDGCDHLLSTGKQGKTGARADRRHTQTLIQRNVCRRCGAARVDRQMGLEANPDEFIAGMVAVFREAKRVLRDDGTVWLNIGDTYAGGGNGGGGNFAADRRCWESIRPRTGQRPAIDGCKPKDLVGVPWMLAFALRADGWYLRQEIIWHKTNPLPESVRDRCTKAHEQIFLLAKSGKPTCWVHEDGTWVMDASPPTPDYVWRNSETRQESATPRLAEGWRRVNRWQGRDYYFDQDAIMESTSPLTNPRVARGHSAKAPSAGRVPGAGPKSARNGSGIRANDSWHASTTEILPLRNKRTVWSVGSDSFPGAHFATYPPALIEPCILAGCPKGGVVLDPFFGAGTTGLVAERLQRDCIGIELNPKYALMARRRIRADLGRVECALPDINHHGPLFAAE